MRIRELRSLLEQLSAEEIATRLRLIGTDEAKFAHLLGTLKTKAFNKEKVIEVAALYTGQSPYTGHSPAWKTKNKALDAIRTRFEDDVYQASKLEQVDKVTPW
jgi:hypothetical protein